MNNRSIWSVELDNSLGFFEEISFGEKDLKIKRF